MTPLAAFAAALAAPLPACVADDPGMSPDPGSEPADTCGADSDRFLPFDAGRRWTYQVTSVESGERSMKDQRVELDDDPALGAVLVQVTEKLAGSTRSTFVADGDRLVRLEQRDIDATGALERTTAFEPGKTRLDESAERLVEGASWEESYNEIVTEVGGGTKVEPATDHWQVLGVDVPCASPLGSFTCLHVRRTSVIGGVAVKEYYFARGVGKVREEGGKQIEELLDCGG